MAAQAHSHANAHVAPLAHAKAYKELKQLITKINAFVNNPFINEYDEQNGTKYYITNPKAISLKDYPFELLKEILINYFYKTFRDSIIDNDMNYHNALFFINQLLFMIELTPISIIKNQVEQSCLQVLYELFNPAISLYNKISHIPSPKRIITLFIYGHGCDVPNQLMREVRHIDVLVPKVIIMSAVSHGCINRGLFTFTEIDSVNETFSNTRKSPRIAMENFRLQFTEHRNKIRQQDMSYGRIHTPSTDRRYSFEKDGPKGIPHAGLYLISSSIDDDIISFDYTTGLSNNILEFRKDKDEVRKRMMDQMQLNNILEPGVHPSLVKYHRSIKKMHNITLQDMIYFLFDDHKLDELHLIDWGCRKTCDDFVGRPDLHRFPSSEYERFETFIPREENIGAAQAGAAQAGAAQIGAANNGSPSAGAAQASAGKRKRRKNKSKRRSTKNKKKVVY
jgi:hypothetical protein